MNCPLLGSQVCISLNKYVWFLWASFWLCVRLRKILFHVAMKLCSVTLFSFIFLRVVLIFVEWHPQHLTTFSSSLIGYRFNSLINFSNVCSLCCLYILRYSGKTIKTVLVHNKGYSLSVYRSIRKLFCLKRQSHAIPGFHFEEKMHVDTIYLFWT